MIKCPYCQEDNVDSALFCSECGTYLLAEEHEVTGMLTSQRKSSKPFSQGEDQESGPVRLRLQFADLDRELEFKVNARQELVIGRSDPATGVFPEVDLASEDAFEKGVSRRHARIAERGGTLVIEDLGSINGTSVNQKRLPPYLPTKLSNGDLIQIGQISVRTWIDRPPTAREG